jgi:YVTN family beta-propeller protein
MQPPEPMNATTTLLRYDISTDPFPLQASPKSGDSVVATLKVAGSNPKPSQPVQLQGLSITLPVGTDASDLTDNAPISAIPPDGWSLTDTKKGQGSVEYVFKPNQGQGLVSKQGLVFSFDNIQINAETGTCQITVKEGSAGNPVEQLYVTKFPNAWGAVSFWLDPPDIPYQGSTTLNWEGPAGATYSIEYVMDGEAINVPTGGTVLGSQGQYPAQGDPPLTLERTTVFTLLVNEVIDEQSYNAQCQKTVTVELPMPVINLFRASLDTSSIPTLILEWATGYAEECELTGSPYLLKPSSPEGGAKFILSSINPLLSVYTLMAINDTGTTSASIAVEFQNPITIPEGMPPNLYCLRVTPDSALLYVGQTEGGPPDFGGPAVCAFDVRTIQPSSPCASVPFDNGFDFSPDGSLLYGAAASGTLSVLDARTLKVLKTVNVGGSVGGTAVSHDEKLLYLADSQINAVRVIDAGAFQPVGNPAPVEHSPYGIDVSPDGSKVYVTLLVSIDPTQGGSVVAFDTTGDPVNPLKFSGQVNLDYAPYGVAVSPDGERVFVVSGVRDQSNPEFTVFDYAVMVFDAALQPAGSSVPLSLMPFGVAVSPDGTRLFATSFGALSAFAPTFTGGVSG